MATTGLNKVMLIGRIDGDPHFKTGGKAPRLWMRVHCVEEIPDENGIPRARQTWLSVVVFGPRAAGLAKFLRAGRRIAVDGRINHWKREGEHPPRWETQIVARDVVLLDEESRSTTVALRPPNAVPGASDEAA